MSILGTYSQVFGAFAGDPDAKDVFGTEGCKVMGNYIKVRCEGLPLTLKESFPDESVSVCPQVGGSSENKEVSVIVPMFEAALRIESALRVMCSQENITLENPYADKDIRSYVAHCTLLEYTLHVWRDGPRLHFGVDGDASFFFREEVRGN